MQFFQVDEYAIAEHEELKSEDLGKYFYIKHGSIEALFDDLDQVESVSRYLLGITDQRGINITIQAREHRAKTNTN